MLCRYSNEDFDVSQNLADRLTDADRAAGRPAPRFGYSGENFKRAADAVRECDTAEQAAKLLGLSKAGA
jgi:hypothetical protein